MKAITCLVLLSLVVFINAQVFTIDVSQPTKPFNHFWEQCVGSGHALLGTRADWQRHLTTVHAELGFQQVRFHGLFDDDMSAILDGGDYSFFDIDTVFDFLTSINMRPLVELSFMPEYLASGPQTIFHYKGNITPPKNVTQWQQFLVAFANHLIDRYGWSNISQWSFEVWNEPNCGFFAGTEAQYYQFFKQTFQALKSVNNNIRVGGPATCQSGWLADFMTFCQQNQLAYDFISTHEYPSDIQNYDRNVMLEVFTKARAQVGAKTPLYYTEFNDGLNPVLHDYPYASSFIFHVMHQTQGLVDVASWWTFTDIFEEGGLSATPYFGGNGWGLLNKYGVPKATYRAFQILHNVGTAEIPTTASANSTVGVYAIVSADGASLDIIAYNYDVPTSTVLQNETITIQINNLKKASFNATLTRIDDANANAPAAWLAQGSPAYPTRAQIDAQFAASIPKPQTIQAQKVTQTSVQFTLTLPKWGSAHLWIPLV